MLKWFHTGIAQLVEHRSPKPGVGSSNLSARAKFAFLHQKWCFLFYRFFVLVYNGYVMDHRILGYIIDLIVEFFASFIVGGFILWIISFFIAKKIKKENFTFAKYMIILFFIIPPLLVIIGSIIDLLNSVCYGSMGGYRCASIMIGLFFWFYPIHFALALIFAISRKKSKLQKLESQKSKDNSR